MPTRTVRNINKFLHHHRLLVLLVALISLFVIFPILHEYFYSYLVVTELAFTVILLTGIYIVSENKELLTVAILLALLTFSVIWFNIFIQSKNLMIFGLLLEVAFFVLTTVAILKNVLSYERVTADKIYGAICGYLLIGVIWGLIFTSLETIISGAFAFHTGIQVAPIETFTHPSYFFQFTYYSFVTLTTLGYGDITPLSSAAKALSALEAVSGQLYLAVLIARLVGLHISHTILDHHADKDS